MHKVRGHIAATRAADATDAESLSAREVLQETMVRKRRNEAIRQQEFAQLRLLRQRNEAVGQAAPAQAQPDDALSSVLGQESRSTATLQKIDAIEAQMSGQWWRQPASTSAKGAKPAAQRQPNSKQLSDLPVLGEDSAVQPVASAVPETKPASSPRTVPVVRSPASKAFSVLRTFKPHPDLEEAAILFAHGDLESARTRLLEQLLQSLSVQQPVDENKVGVLWHAVLDLCRALGDEAAFEPLAIDYAEHFGRSAPLWFSIPARIGLPALYGDAHRVPPQRQFQWRCPAVLTLGAVTALDTAQAEAPQPWCVSWLRLESIDAAALPALAQLLDAWASHSGQFVFSDAGTLLHLLEQHTAPGDKASPAPWWALRMAVLRMMGRMETYEQVALDYCVTYEVSPPSWVDPVCQCVVQEEGEANVSILQAALLPSAIPLSAPASQLFMVPDMGKGLAGVIEGDPQPWLEAIAAQAQRGQVLDIPCCNLIRLDFVAAGSILNWAADMQNRGYSLRFTQLHQLVAAFFYVIGIQEHATLQDTLA